MYLFMKASVAQRASRTGWSKMSRRRRRRRRRIATVTRADQRNKIMETVPETLWSARVRESLTLRTLMSPRAISSACDAIIKGCVVFQPLKD